MIPTHDLVFDDFGDIKITNGDIATTNNKAEILRQNCVDRIRSSFDDYKLYRSYGANLSANLGKPITESLELSMQESVVRSLVFDNFLKRDEVKCVVVNISPHQLFIKTEISTIVLGYSFTTITINSIFNTINGVINVN